MLTIVFILCLCRESKGRVSLWTWNWLRLMGSICRCRQTTRGSATDSSGVYNDNQRGLHVQLEARCSNTYDCAKYMLLVTVYKDSQLVYQTFAISYASDCTFYVSSSSAGNGNYHRDITSAEATYSNIRPVGDIDTCPQ